jgi:DNA polymerase-1
VYGSERKRAKGINFSIAYGKTSHGFAKDWNCSVEEAEKIVNKWFEDRPEVRQWQNRTKEIALKEGYTQTLLGRYRNLSEHFRKQSKTKMHGLRAAINTPIQVFGYYKIGRSC